MPLPEPLGKPFKSLGEPIKALICEEEECGYITINRSVMGQHCNKKHVWRSTRTQKEYWHNIWVQTFFGSRRQRYFSVQWSEEEHSRVTSRLDVLEKLEIDLIEEEWQDELKKHGNELEKVDEEVAKQDRTGWFNETGWVAHLAKSNLKHLAHTSRLPDRDEEGLAQAVQLVEKLLERSVTGLRTLHKETRRWLRSAQPTVIDPRPIARLQNRDSQLRYAGYWKRFICYCLRVSKRAGEKRQQGRAGESSPDCSPDSRPGSTSDIDSGEYLDGDTDGNSDSDSNTQTARYGSDTLHDAERLFPWSGDQLALAERLQNSIEWKESEDTQLDLLLDLSKAFIFQHIYTDPFESGLIHFLSVLGIDEEMGRLRTANDYSYMLAGMVYDVRMFAVESLLPSSERDTQGKLEIDHFLEQRKEYLADGSYGPMSRMISLLAYGKHLALNHGNAGMIDWPSEDVMTLHGKRIYMSRFKKMVHNGIAQAEHILWEELMWCGWQERFEVPLDTLEDDVTFTKRGFSFTSKKSNKLDNGRGWMLAQATKTEGGRKLRKDGEWQRYKVGQYLKTFDKFRELLLFLVHLTGGQPARGPEITSLRFKNGFLQDRNVFVMSGQMTTVTRYHKSQSQWDTPKVIPRFLPWKVGQLLVVFISYMQPFREMLSVKVMGGGWTDYLWADEKGPWETDKMTKVIARETAKGLGVRLTTHSYRHTAAAIGRKKVGAMFARGFKEEIGETEEDEEGEGEDGEDPNELAAGRGSAVGGNRYGVSSSIVKHLSLRSIDTFRPLCEKWHEFLGLESYGAKGKKRAAEEEAGRSSTAKRNRLTTSEFQSGIRRVLSRLDSQQAAQMSRPSEKWYFGQSTDRTATRHSSRSGATDDELSSLPKSSTPTEEELEKAMQRALGKEKVSFRSEEQQEAMRAIAHGETPLVVVLPTGGGKSLLFIAPACMERDAGITIVVVPYRQLTNEVVKRAKSLRIDCEEWRYDMTDPSTLMVVSADMLINHRFLDFAARMRSKGILRRVFLDECHLAFTANSWRERLVYMKNVRHLQVPTIFLTATLPPTLEYDFEESLALQYARYIRACTARVSTRYYVNECKRGALQETVSGACRRRMAHFRQGEKGVVYCRSREETEDLAKEIGCGFVHAKGVENEGSIAGWLEEGGFIVATSALGTGVDYPGIIFVLHAGMPYGMIDYAQESGRAGRGGEEVSSVIVVEEGFVDEQERRGKIKSVDERAIVEYLRTEGCRRAVFSSYFDGEAYGKELVCDDNGDLARCDRCGEGEVDVQRSERVMAEDRELVESILDDVADGCTSCWLADLLERDSGEGDGIGWQHRREECERAQREEEEGEGFRRRVVFDRDTHSCHKCSFSQKMCRTGADVREKCQWPRIAICIAIAACRNGIGRGIIRRAGFKGELGGGLEDYRRWLGWRHKVRIWEQRMSNTMAVVLEFVIWSVSVS